MIERRCRSALLRLHRARVDRQRTVLSRPVDRRIKQFGEVSPTPMAGTHHEAAYSPDRRICSVCGIEWCSETSCPIPFGNVSPGTDLDPADGLTGFVIADKARWWADIDAPLEKRLVSFAQTFTNPPARQSPPHAPAASALALAVVATEDGHQIIPALGRERMSVRFNHAPTIRLRQSRRQSFGTIVDPLPDGGMAT